MTYSRLAGVRPLVVACSVLLMFVAWASWFTGEPGLAQNQNFIVTASLQSVSGGVSQYGIAIQGANSQSASQQAVGNWNSYVQSRASWSLSSASVTRVANANWTARQSGSPVITAQQLANAATQLINGTLVTLNASQQQSLLAQNAAISTSGGYFSPNAIDPNVTATQNGDGTWTVSVVASEFSSLKSFFQQNAPGTVSSGQNFYPAEAVMIAYCAATGDLGYDSGYISGMKQMIGAAIGMDLTAQQLFGNNGYMARRPLSTFLTEGNTSQFFTSLGF